MNGGHFNNLGERGSPWGSAACCTSFSITIWSVEYPRALYTMDKNQLNFLGFFAIFFLRFHKTLLLSCLIHKFSSEVDFIQRNPQDFFTGSKFCICSPAKCTVLYTVLHFCVTG